MKVVSGYGGVMSTEGLTYHDGLSVFYMTDPSKCTLIIIPLAPGFLYEVYHVVKMPNYTNIVIVMPTLDQYMISDLINLVRVSILEKGASHVRWVCANDISEWNTDIMKETRIINASFFLDQIFKIGYKMEPMIKFIPAHTSRTSSIIYNILIWDGKKQIYIMNYTRLLELNRLANDNTIEEIHLPWKPVWGGITGFELATGLAEHGGIASAELEDKFWSSNSELSVFTYEQMEKMTHMEIEKVLADDKGKVIKDLHANPKFRYHSFPSDAIYIMAKERLHIKLVEVIWHDLV